MEESDSDNALKTAESLHDQAQYLLDDEIGYATSLRDSRKTAAGLLIVVIGIGIFRFDLYRPKDHVLVVPEWAAWVIRILFLMGIVIVSCGAYLIYTERPIFREFQKSQNGSKGGGALSILFLRQSVLKQFQDKPPLQVMNMRTTGLRLAYSRLRDANRRVRIRLARGTACVFVGLAFVMVAFGMYTLSVKLNVERRQDDPNERQQQTKQVGEDVKAR